MESGFSFRGALKGLIESCGTMVIGAIIPPNVADISSAVKCTVDLIRVGIDCFKRVKATKEARRDTLWLTA